MFRIRRLIAAFALSLVAGIGLATVEERTNLISQEWDMEGEAADADQVLTAAAGVMADSTDYSALKAADPDVCRLVDITVNDVANITAGTFTVGGTDCWGDPLTTTWSFTGADDDGIKNLTVTSGRATGAYFSTVTLMTTNALTGEGGADTITVGYTTNSPWASVLHGRRRDIPTIPWRTVDLNEEFDIPIRIRNNTTTTLTAVTAASAPFRYVVVGDILVFTVDSSYPPRTETRLVTAKADNDNVTINSAITLSNGTAGQTFSYRKRYISSDPQDGWVGVHSWDQVTFSWSVDANASTGGVNHRMECAPPGAAFAANFLVGNGNVATGVSGNGFYAIDRTGVKFDYCRLQFQFGTNDDADAGGPERISAWIGFEK